MTGFAPGDAVFGVTNPQFTGAYAEYAVAEAGMLAPKPEGLGFVEAASVPVVATAAWQMVFDHGGVDAAKRVLIHGAAGNVGAYAVQLAKQGGAIVFATAHHRDIGYVERLGADLVIDNEATPFEEVATGVDVVIDTVGGALLDRSFAVLKPGGVLVSTVAPPDQDKARQFDVRALFFLVAVTNETLSRIARLIESGELAVAIGDVLPLSQARTAHEMLAGKPHQRGKIVLVP